LVVVEYGDGGDGGVVVVAEVAASEADADAAVALGSLEYVRVRATRIPAAWRRPDDKQWHQIGSFLDNSV
jgi:hypothetical protein